MLFQDQDAIATSRLRHGEGDGANKPRNFTQNMGAHVARGRVLKQKTGVSEDERTQ